MRYLSLLPMFCVASVASLQAEPVSIEALPPVEVKTVPVAGDGAVDPATKEIRVTFSKNMLTEKMWSLVTVSRETFPKIDGQMKYLPDKRTFVAPVKLEPGRTYALWINQGRFTSFRDAVDNPAVPYLLVFHTRK
jgi:RNA polymerase sigma-70 factor (ECF subfamily)